MTYLIALKRDFNKNNFYYTSIVCQSRKQNMIELIVGCPEMNNSK